MNMASGFDGSTTIGSLEDRASLALSAGRMATFEWDVEGDVLHFDRAFRELFRLTVLSAPALELFSRVHRDDMAIVNAKIARALRGSGDYDAQFRILQADGTTTWIGARGRVTEWSPCGAARRLLGLAWDMSEAKDQEERLKHLVREMNHRVNNAFALMESMLVLGGATVNDVGSLSSTLCAQVHAMADANKLASNFFLHSQEDNDTVAIEDVVRRVLRSWSIGPLADKICIDVDDSRVRAYDVTPLAMILHEFATNATKYSVLGPQDGSLRISVHKTDAATIRLSWEEHVSRPRDSAAKTSPGSGLGALLLEHCLVKMRAQLVDRRCDKAGWRWVLELADPDRSR